MLFYIHLFVHPYCVIISSMEQPRTKKICPKCKSLKALSDFCIRRSSKDGRDYQCKACKAINFKNWVGSIDIKNYNRKVNLRRLFGISIEQWEEIYSRQGGKCAICTNTTCVSGRRLNVDHDHVTNEIRGLLCDLCNRSLGLMRDSPTLLRNAINYLEGNTLEKR